MLFFSSSSTKLVTYLLPIYIPAAFICGYIWNNADKFRKPLLISTYITGILFAIVAIAGISTPIFLPDKIYSVISSAKWLTVSISGLCAILCFIAIKKNKLIIYLASCVVFMTLISAFGTKEFFNIDYKFGQNDLMEFARYAKEYNYDLGAVNLGRKYSLLYYKGSKVDYADEEEINNLLNDYNKLIVVKNKLMPELLENKKYTVIKTGKRYSLIKGF